MFTRLLWQMIRGNRGRLVVALIAIASGAAVISTLLNLEFDARKKVTQEFRSLGANVVISGYGTGEAALLNEASIESMLQTQSPKGTLAAPYLYIVARTKSQSVVLAGTRLDLALQLNPTWQIEGNAATASQQPPQQQPPQQQQCLAGKDAVRQLGLTLGANLALTYESRQLNCTIAAIITAGSDEDTQIFANIAAVQQLAALPNRIALTELRIPGPPKEIEAFATQIAATSPSGSGKVSASGSGNIQARPIRQIAETEAALLGRIQLLIFSMAALILILTALCVLATMAALAMERRADVGLMKALGGSIGRVVGLFLAEVGVLGAAGGVIGYIVGIAITLWAGRRVFGTTISPRPEVFPITVALMIVVALAGALPLRLLGKVKPAVILRGD